jgi:aspartyl aminopeptidase
MYDVRAKPSGGEMSKPKDGPSGAVQDLMAFLDASPTAYHAAARMEQTLVEAGFTRLVEGDEWKLEAGGRYYAVRNGSALAAFVTGSEPVPEGGLRIVGAHTDSPALKLKPNASVEKGGYVTLGVEVYGGPILATWTDRDLRIAGRAAVRSAGSPMGVESRLVWPERPRVVVPNLAIHLNRKVNDDGLKLNAQENLPALFGLDAGDPPAAEAVTRLVASELGVDPGEVMGFDLILCDAQPASVAGPGGEFVRSGRIDDLAMCHAGLAALLEAGRNRASFTRMLVFYDNEEVGSMTAQGAASPFLTDVIERVAMASGGREALMRAVARSWLVSADMAHALNPNYASKHDGAHRPLLGGGPVLKVNASRRYATDAEGQAVFERICRDADVPVQRYVNRSDLPCGSTIGPIASSRLGMRTIDVGNPILAMHSIRETCGALDQELMIRALAGFFSDAS